MSVNKRDPGLLEKQVISKKRVTDHGEVYTHKREVNAMLDLVRQETERIDSRFLEPACGIGNFLAEVLERKLRVVESDGKKVADIIVDSFEINPTIPAGTFNKP